MGEVTLPREILETYRTVAVVGLSRDPQKESYRVARYLKEAGYEIIPINPSAGEILGETCYRSLKELPESLKGRVEVVVIFRPSAEALPIVEEAVELTRRYGRLRAVWMQLGIVNAEAEKEARRAGLAVVMDRCMMADHRRFGL
jgi:hypothetical protein